MPLAVLSGQRAQAWQRQGALAGGGSSSSGRVRLRHRQGCRHQLGARLLARRRERMPWLPLSKQDMRLAFAGTVAAYGGMKLARRRRPENVTGQQCSTVSTPGLCPCATHWLCSHVQNEQLTH
jgi:hypothetical protein